jgi:uncharacterized protein YrzB (UPF0473 family)
VSGAGWERAEPIRLLRDVYGDDVELIDEQGKSVEHRILAEFKCGGTAYAVLQSDRLRKEKEVAIYKVTERPDGEPELATIEDDDEWEMVSELYDEMAFPVRDRP